MPPQNMLWHLDYFELKALEKQIQEKHSDLSFFIKADEIPIGMSSLYPEGRCSYHQG